MGPLLLGQDAVLTGEESLESHVLDNSGNPGGGSQLLGGGVVKNVLLDALDTPHPIVPWSTGLFQFFSFLRFYIFI